MKIKDITKNLKLSYIENDSLDDFLELLQDYWLLTTRWIAIKKIIWEETEKWVRDIVEDPYERSWNTFNSDTKNYLISEARKWGLNERARTFINKIAPQSPL